MAKTKVDTKTKDPKKAFPNSRDRIVYAFTIDGTPYFQFDDINAIPCERGFQALAYFNELNQRCTRDFLIAHTQAVENCLNDNNGIKITQLVKLNMILKERLEFLIEPEIAYKICSVVFFDETENPYRYEFKYGAQKADIFKRCKMDDFFLSQPITKLIPYIASFGSDLQTYCQTINLITKEHIKNISTMLSEAHKKSEWFNSLASLLSKDMDLEKLKSYLSMSTT